MFALRSGTTTIAKGLKVSGNLETSGSVKLSGEIEGELTCEALFVFPTARVDGVVNATRVVVNGTVQGPIRAEEVVLKARAHIVGDIYCRALSVEKGAYVEGRLFRMLDAQENSDTAKPLLHSIESEKKLTEGETSTRIAELVVEARDLSGNPDLLSDDAIAFLAKKGNAEARVLANSAQAPAKASAPAR